MIAYVLVKGPGGHVLACDQIGSQYVCAACQGLMEFVPVMGGRCPHCDSEIVTLCIPDTPPPRRGQRQLALF